MMFRELPILERFGAARDAGVEVVLINVDIGDLRTGGPGLSGVPGRETEVRAAVTRTLDASRILGASRIHLGPSRVPPGTSRAERWEVYRANLSWAVRQAAGHPATTAASFAWRQTLREHFSP